MSLLHSPKIVTNGLVLCLDAADRKSYPGNGTTWNDRSGNENNWTLIGGITYSNNNSGSLILDGINDYIQQNQDLLLSPNFTISLTIKQTSAIGDWVRLFGHGNASQRFWGIWMPSNRSSLLWQSYSNGGQVFSSAYTFNLNEIYNIVLTSSGSTRNFYINGQFLSTHSTGGTINYVSNTDKITIGYAGFHTYFIGSIYNASIYNQTLTNSEIQQNFNVIRGRFGI
jgi:hypothetical protein